MPINETVFGNGHSFDMAVNEVGVALVARWELVKLVPYKDAHKSGFRWAIGLGHVEGGDNEPKIIDPAVLGYTMKITRKQAYDILALDLEDKARWLRQKITVPVTSFMFQGLISLTANAGQGNVLEGPILPLLNAEKYVAAAVAFLHHNKAWLPVKDEKGNEVLNPETGEPILALQVSNGLTVRRCTEIGVFMTKMEK